MLNASKIIITLIRNRSDTFAGQHIIIDRTEVAAAAKASAKATKTTPYNPQCVHIICFLNTTIITYYLRFIECVRVRIRMNFVFKSDVNERFRIRPNK